MDADDPAQVLGYADGYERGHVRGWAWYPNRPAETVTVELLVGGAKVAEGIACQLRADLKTNGIGHGRYAFAIPFVVEPDAPPVLQITVRAKHGPVLQGGDFELATSEEDRAREAERRSLAYLQKVFGPFAADAPPPRRAPPAAPPTQCHFILYSATGGSDLAAKLGAPEYSYFFVMREFRAVLRRLGTVHVVRDPARDVNPIYDSCAARGETCLFLSFAPPSQTTLGLRCPTIPVIAWEYGTIPTAVWEHNPRNDWRYVLRQTGRAITISGFAARAIKAAMGPDFPVVGIPAPVWDRLADLRARVAAGGALGALALQGFVWDSRSTRLELGMALPPVPVVSRRASVPAITRGWKLALAASEEAARAARAAQAADAAAAARAREEAEAAAREAAEAAAQEAAAEAARAEEAARAAAPPQRKTMRHRAGLTARIGLMWYREVVRDLVPRPARWALGGGGRLAVKARRALRPAPKAIAPVEIVPEIAAPLPEMHAPPLVAVTQALADPFVLPPPPGAEGVPDLEAFAPPVLADFVPQAPWQAPPAPPAADQARVDLSGIVFTAVLAPKDGRKNWQDILSAFCTEFQQDEGATLVLKMIATDPDYWWWELHDLASRLPPFACRVVVLHGYLDDANYQALIQATHFVVNASLAEGMCLPLVEFMSAGRPAVAPRHTAMLDYITEENALIVASDIEACGWPADPRNHLITTRHRIDWPSLRRALRAAWHVARNDSERYAQMADAARASMRAYCADDVVAPELASLLGLPAESLTAAGWQARAAAPAERWLAP